MCEIEKQIEDYLWYCEKVRQMSEATLSQKRCVLTRFVNSTGITKLENLTNQVFDTWIAGELKQNVAKSTMNCYSSILVAMIRYYREVNPKSNIPINLTLVTKLRITQTTRKYYSPEEIALVIKMSDFETGLMIRIMFETGMRIAELTNLRLANFSGRQVSFIGKGRKLRQVYLGKETLQLVEQWIEAKYIQDYLWGVSLNGLPPTTVTIRKRMQRAFSAAGFPGFYPHALRHSFATNLQMHGANIYEIKEMIGHSSIATTERYLHGFDNRLEQLFDKYHV